MFASTAASAADMAASNSRAFSSLIALTAAARQRCGGLANTCDAVALGPSRSSCAPRLGVVSGERLRGLLRGQTRERLRGGVGVQLLRGCR